MANITPPYADPGRASFEELDTYLQNYLLAGSHPEMAPAYPFKLPYDANYAQFTVLGLNASDELVPATYGAAPSAATGTLTFSGVGTAADTITIGNRVYTLVAALTAANQVLIGANVTASAANLAAAINGAAGEGTTYGTGTAPNAQVSATSSAGVVTITARETGDDGNEIATTESGSGTAFGATTLTGGKDSSGVRAIGVLAHAASRGASPAAAANGIVWYSGNFNMDALVWDESFDTDAKKASAFFGAPTPTNIIIGKRG